MCTVSWLHHDSGYRLFSNRDEKRARPRALPPEIQDRDGVLFVAPTDAESSGTWIATNEFGISFCLLNGVPERGEPGGKAFRSRGLIIPELLVASSQMEAAERAWSLDLTPFAPFTLVILEAGQHTTAFAWDGGEKLVITYAEPYTPLSSSSYDPGGVQLRRQQEFRRLLTAAGELNAGLLFDFHRSHGDGPDAYSPCMHRNDAETVSFSSVRVTDEEIEFSYLPGAPCGRGPQETLKLARTG